MTTSIAGKIEADTGEGDQATGNASIMTLTRTSNPLIATHSAGLPQVEYFYLRQTFAEASTTYQQFAAKPFFCSVVMLLIASPPAAYAAIFRSVTIAA